MNLAFTVVNLGAARMMVKGYNATPIDGVQPPATPPGGDATGCSIQDLNRVALVSKSE